MFKKWKLRRKIEKQGTYKAVFDRFDLYVTSHNGRIKSFIYYPRIFGYFEIVITYMGADYKFENDRGVIYCNEKFVCDGSYHVPGEYHAVDKVIDLMGEIVFKH